MDYQAPTVAPRQAWLGALARRFNPNPIKAGNFVTGLSPIIAVPDLVEILEGLLEDDYKADKRSRVWFTNCSD